ncbi:MAG: tetratricopeptide repeat protein, partial [Verrucomicrobiota bacterium]
SSPTNVAARLQLAGTFAMQGKTDIALKEYADVLQANPNDATAHSRLASLQMRTGNIKDAIAHYRAAIAARPEFADAMNNLAWTLATNPNAEFRDGPEAVSLAERACQLTNYQQAFMIGTLAAAYAEAGRFPDAISTAGKAQELAAKSNDPELAAKNGKLLELYRAGKAYRDDGR